VLDILGCERRLHRTSIPSYMQPQAIARTLQGTPNVVVLVFDAMRRDVLPVYGGRSATPNIDRFCADSTAYPDCIAPSPWTIPSHASLFTGKYPSEHGIHETHDLKAQDLLGMQSSYRGEVLAETLNSKGYQTVGFPANPMLTLKPGFDRGFESFTSHRGALASPEDMAMLRSIFEEGKSKPAVLWSLARKRELGKAVDLLRTARRINKFRARSGYPRSKYGDLLVSKVKETELDPPFFLFANFMEMHDPYVGYELLPANRGPFPTVGAADLYGYKTISESDMAEIRRGYYSNASTLDAYFGGFVAALKDKGVFDDTVFIVTSDHGQALKERGYYGHGTFLHDEILRIPLIVRNRGGKKLATGGGYQTLVNIPRFVIDLVEGGDGAGAISSEIVLAESFGTQQGPPAGAASSLAGKIEEVRKRVDRPLAAAYMGGFRLVADPSAWEVEEFTRDGEPADRSEHRGEIDAMVAELRRVRAAETKVERPEALSLEEESAVAERLKELGYL
jgi:arylsulfatase A-like enzyme